MAKCPNCGKRHPLFSGKTGLCDTCLAIAQSMTATQSMPSHTPKSTPPSVSAPKKALTHSEKERLAVQRTTLSDMQLLSGFPFVWNRNIEKSLAPGGHPFAYMDIVGPNIATAKSELEKINSYIQRDKAICKAIPSSLRIPTDEIVFVRSTASGYSRLICSPVTYNGKPASIPLQLSFMTNMERKNTTHGDLYYSQSGQIHRADIHFWRNGNGYFLYYDTVNGEFTLSKVAVPDYSGKGPSIVYRGQHLLESEAKRTKEEADFSWLQTNIPELCPETITTFRRNKTQNTKSYQTLKSLAAEKGREI